MARACPGHYPARYCGRDFTGAELDVIVGLATALPTARRPPRAVCGTSPG
jgi:hypothetical protein